MSLSATLATARTGMAATGVRAQTASSNIANVSTPGYVRRDTSVSQNGATGGVTTDVARTQDRVLVQSRRDAQSQSAHSGVIEDAMQRALSAFGEPGSSTGVFGTFTQFENDLQTLRSTPESGAAQAIAVDSLKDLTQALTTASQDLQTERTRADANLSTDIDQANELAADLFKLNNDIRTASGAGRNTAPLLDQRDQILDKLSAYLPLNVTYENTGAVAVRTDSGLTLVGVTLNEIEFSPANRVGPLDSPEPVGRLSIPTLNGQPIGPNSGGHGITEGRIAAHLTLRDTDIPRQSAALDDFAYDLASAFQAVGEPLLLDAGAAVDINNKVGLSERLSVNPLVDPSRGGDATRLRDGLAAATQGAPSEDGLLTQLVDTIAPFSDRLGSVISDVSSEVYRAERIHTGNLARETTLFDADAELSAVDLDNELQSLLAIEQAYSANARVIQTVSDIFDILARL